jgi:hypothetical protein
MDESYGKAEPRHSRRLQTEYTVPRVFSSQSSDGECDSTVEISCLSGAYTLNASPDSMQVLRVFFCTWGGVVMVT